MMKLTENRRIFLNVCATYARTLLNVACGLFSVRWVLAALGETDFGLYGVVGGLMVFAIFINELFSSAVTRFYALSLGRAKVAEDKMVALEDCRGWFSAALAVQTILPLCLVVVGYPIGEYAINHEWLNIPPDRVSSCVWVWRFSCISGFSTMIASPIWAMYMAKQNIAEMTGFYMAQTIIRTGFIYCMTLFSRDWLVLYASFICFLVLSVQVAYTTNAFLRFPECKIRIKEAFNPQRWRQLISFSGWRSFMGLGQIANGQGVAILVNRMFGANANASMSIANQLAGEAAALSGALQGAFSPAVTTAYGAGEYDKMRLLAFRVCRYSTLLMLLFAIPLSLELDEVLHLWLKNPPQYANKLCICMMLTLVLEKCSLGHTLAVNACGRVALYYFVHGMLKSSSVLVAWLFIVLNCGIKGVGVAMALSTGVVVMSDVLLARSRSGMRIGEWLWSVVRPILIVAGVTVLCGIPSTVLFPPSFIRVCVTTLCCLLAFLPTAFLMLEKVEKEKIILFIKDKIVNKGFGR